MTEKEWNAKCGGMFLGLLGAYNLAKELGLDPWIMLDMLAKAVQEGESRPATNKGE